MRLRTTLLAVLLNLLPIALGLDEFEAAAAPPQNARTATLYSWPLSAPTPKPFATVSFSPRTFTGTYSSLDNALSSEELVRVGILNEKTGSWSGSVTTGGMIMKASGVEITLHVDTAGNAWHVEVAENAGAAGPTVSVVKVMLGATPVLNKPVVLSPDGTVPQPVVEKTFLQKYWWVFLAMVILLIGGGGGE